MKIFSAFKAELPETFPMLSQSQLESLKKTWEKKSLRLIRLKRFDPIKMRIEESDELEMLLKLQMITSQIASHIDEAPQNIYPLILNISDLDFSDETSDIQFSIMRELLHMNPSIDIEACLDKIYVNQDDDEDIHAMKCCTLVQYLEMEENPQLQQKIIELLEKDFLGHPTFEGESLPDFALKHGHQVLVNYYYPPAMSDVEKLKKLHEVNMYFIEKSKSSLLQIVLDNPSAFSVLFNLYPEGQFYRAVQVKNAQGENVLHWAATHHLCHLNTLMTLLSLNRLKMILSEKTEQGLDLVHHAKDHPLAVQAILLRFPIEERHCLLTYEWLKYLIWHHPDEMHGVLGVLDKNWIIQMLMGYCGPNQDNLLHMAAQQMPHRLVNILTLFSPFDAHAAMMSRNQLGDAVWHILSREHPESLCELLKKFSPDNLHEIITIKNHLGQSLVHLAYQDRTAIVELFKRYPTDNHRLEVLKDKDLTGNTVLTYMNQNGLVDFEVLTACLPQYLSLKAIRLLLQMPDIKQETINAIKNVMIQHIDQLSDTTRASKFCFFKAPDQATSQSTKKLEQLHEIKAKIQQASDRSAFKKAMHELDPFIKIPLEERSRLQPNTLKRIIEHNKFKLI